MAVPLSESSDFTFVCFLFYADEPTATPPYEGTWYDDYDEYGMSMDTCRHTQMFCIRLTGSANKANSTK